MSWAGVSVVGAAGSMLNPGEGDDEAGCEGAGAAEAGGGLGATRNGFGRSWAGVGAEVEGGAEADGGAGAFESAPDDGDRSMLPG